MRRHFLECRLYLYLGIGREFAGVGFRQTALYLLDLPRLRLDEYLERPIDDPRSGPAIATAVASRRS